MTVRYTQRFNMHMRLGRGGYGHGYEILDGTTVIGSKTVIHETRKGPTTVTYELLGGARFDSAEKFIAAYEAQAKSGEAAA